MVLKVAPFAGEVRFLSGVELTREIKRLLKTADARVAVAFWGKGSESWVTGPSAKVICNLATGGSNPHALRRLQERTGVELRQCDSLHAKVYLAAERAIVSSANVSANGLGLEGIEQSSWIEAGVTMPESTEVRAWFDELWKDKNRTRGITSADWVRAEADWQQRSRRRPSLASFAEFDCDLNDSGLPLMTWVDDSHSWSYKEDAIRKQVGSFNAVIKQRVDKGMELGHPGDGHILKNRWILCWNATAKFLPKRNLKPFWIQTSDHILHGAYAYDDEPQVKDVVLAPEWPSPRPFDEADKRFQKVLTEILEENRFPSFRADDDGDRPWFSDTLAELRPFWRELHRRYITDLNS